ncbi:MAG: enoyl-CoA hydratase-related protein [Promethearchaeota archaeon]
MCGASWFLLRLIGFGKAIDVILTGRDLDAHEALEIELVNKIYPAGDFNSQIMVYIQNNASLPTRMLVYNKSMLNFSHLNELIPSIQNEFNLTVRNMET